MRTVSDLDLERFLVDDLDPVERDRVAAAVAADPELQAFVATRRDAQDTWRARRMPTPRVAPGVVERLQTALRAWSGLPFVAAAACLALFVVIDGGEGEVRSRGGDHDVALVVQRDGHVFRHQGQPLRSGDAIRLNVGHAGRHVVVVAADLHGRLEVLVDDAVGDGDGWLPGSLVLDDAEGPERWVVVEGERPVEADTVVRAVGRVIGLGAPALPTGEVHGTLEALRRSLSAEPRHPGLTVRLVSFEKEPRP